MDLANQLLGQRLVGTLEHPLGHKLHHPLCVADLELLALPRFREHSPVRLGQDLLDLRLREFRSLDADRRTHGPQDVESVDTFLEAGGDRDLPNHLCEGVGLRDEGEQLLVPEIQMQIECDVPQRHFCPRKCPQDSPGLYLVNTF